MAEQEVLPVGRFSPAPGIWVDRTEKSVRITGNMELYGEEANEGRAYGIQYAINTNWTKNFNDGYSVICDITVRYRGPGTSPSPNATQIEALKPLLNGPSHVNYLPGMGREMTLNANSPHVFRWTSAHEFGHVIGLKDRYSESIMSNLKGHLGMQRTTTVEEGYKGNLMAEHLGGLESKNIADLSFENEPSPYWMNDDNQIRNWLSTHTTAEISKLSTANKLKAIKTLMGGWISSADMTAIGKICDSVTTPYEASTIRKGVNLLDFTDIGQRTQMRVIFSKMPL